MLGKFSIENGLLQYFVSIFCSSSAVTVFLIPVMMLFNGYTSLLSPAANLLVLPMTPCVMILGAVSAVSGGAAGALAGQMSGVLLKGMVSFTELLGKTPFAVFPLNLSFAAPWLLGTGLVILLPAFAGRLRKDGKRAASISAVLLAVGITAHVICNHDTLQITAIKSGDAGSIVVSQNAKALVVGCGSDAARKTAYYMRSIGVYELEMFAAAQNNERQAGGADYLAGLLKPKTILAPREGDYISAAYDPSDSEFLALSASDWEVLDGVSLEIGEGDQPRMVLRGNGQEFFIDADGDFGVLQDGREWLLEKGQKSDTLKPKYDIITKEDIEELEASSFESISRGETVVVRVAKNGKMTIRGK